MAIDVRLLPVMDIEGAEIYAEFKSSPNEASLKGVVREDNIAI